jgi:hypothetical protein
MKILDFKDKMISYYAKLKQQTVKLYLNQFHISRKSLNVCEVVSNHCLEIQWKALTKIEILADCYNTSPQNCNLQPVDTLNKAIQNSIAMNCIR